MAQQGAPGADPDAENALATIAKRRPVERPDRDVLEDLEKNTLEFGLFVVAASHRSVHKSQPWKGVAVTVLLRSLAALLILSMLVLPVVFFISKAKAHYVINQAQACPSTAGAETRLLMIGISVFYVAKMIMRHVEMGFQNNDIESEYREEFKWYTSRQTANSQMRVWNALDGFLHHSYDSIVYGMNLWLIYIETDAVNMIANALVMEFMMGIDSNFRETYLWLARYTVRHELEQFQIVNFSEYKRIDSQDISNVRFRIYKCVSLLDIFFDVLLILFCVFMLFYAPICKV